MPESDKKITLPISYMLNNMQVINAIEHMLNDSDLMDICGREIREYFNRTIMADIHSMKRVNDGKLLAMERRDAYMNYRKSKIPCERENHRQRYLDLTGIPSSWRTDEEIEI